MSRKDHRFTESPVLKDQLLHFLHVWRLHAELFTRDLFNARVRRPGRHFQLQLTKLNVQIIGAIPLLLQRLQTLAGLMLAGNDTNR